MLPYRDIVRFRHLALCWVLFHSAQSRLRFRANLAASALLGPVPDRRLVVLFCAVLCLAASANGREAVSLVRGRVSTIERRNELQRRRIAADRHGATSSSALRETASPESATG